MSSRDNDAMYTEQQLNKLMTEVSRTVLGVIKASTTPPRRTCWECLYFDQVNEGCGLANNARPPAKVIAYGCPSFDFVPF